MATNIMNPLQNLFIKKYKKEALDMLHISFPQLTHNELEYIVDQSILNRVQDHPVEIDNNYKKIKVDSTLLEMANYIMDKQPIITTRGVMFMRHGSMPNPIYNMIDGFITGRKKVKKKMFEYPKGSPEFTKLNLIQLLHKLDANAYYGASGMYSSIYYNLYAATAVTTQGRSAISSAALLFESILANNVPFASLNELIDFIHNVITDPVTINDYQYINHMPTVEETFAKLISSCGFAWIPTDSEMKIVWDILWQLDYKYIIRLYYKNNLYEFCSNTVVYNHILYMLQKLENTFIDPNKIPDEIKDDMELFKKLIYEYVYYPHQIVDRLDKMDALIRDVSILQDTDSSIVSFDAWYRFVLNGTYNIPMKIKQHDFDPINEELLEENKMVEEYSFHDDKIIEKIRYYNPLRIIPQDNLRYSIIAIIANTISYLVNDYMYRYCLQANSELPEKGACMLVMKNEFLFRRLLLTDAKKHYASKQELQEGNVVPEKDSLDVKGMEAFTKSTTAKDTKEKLKKILYEDILNTPAIDQANIISKIAIVEKEIFDSIQRGEKKFYKPVKVKSVSAYEDPMRIQGIKASLAYNELHEPGTEALDMSARNSIDVIKVEITKNNIGLIKDDYPYVYERAMNLLENNQYYKSGIDAIGLPLNEPVPKWVLPFVRYAEIINDNVAKFPLESVGLKRGNGYNNSTNIISF